MIAIEMPATLAVDSPDIPDLESIGQVIEPSPIAPSEELPPIEQELGPPVECTASTDVVATVEAATENQPATAIGHQQFDIQVSKIRQEIREAEEYLGDCGIAEARLKGELKFAREARQTAVENLRILRKDLEELLEDGPQPVGKKVEEFHEAVNSLPPATTTTPTLPPEPDHWRTAPIGLLGLKPALEQRYTEHGINTIGELEDLRSKGNEKGVGLRSIKGIGDAKVTETEDAVIAWLSKNRDAKVLAEAANQPNGQPTTEDPAPTLTAEVANEIENMLLSAEAATESPPIEPPGTTSTTTPAGIRKHDPDAIVVDPKQVLARAKQLNNGTPSCLDKQMKNKNFYEAGQEYYERGDPITACQVIPGPEQDDWLRGWMGAQLLDQYEPSET